MPATAAEAKVLVEYFFSAGCDDCQTINEEVLPGLVEQLGESMDIRRYDINADSNLLHLIRLQNALHITTDDHVSFFLNERIYIGGVSDIRQRLIPEVEAMVIGLAEQPANSEAPGVWPADADASRAVAMKRLDSFTIGVIIAGGLSDGINPCAFATLIFFITLLSVSGRKGRDLIFVGIGFTFAVFTTYFTLGFGLFHLLRTLAVYRILGNAIKLLVLIALAMLAVLSFRDAWIFHRTGRANSITLQLPDRIKRLIHRVMRVNMPTHHLVLGSVVIGFLVTLLESVCTGQVLVPTLTYLASCSGANQARAIRLLLLYNAMFVIPHVVVFIAAYHGATNERFLSWSRRNVAWSKLLMGLFFAALALIMLRL